MRDIIDFSKVSKEEFNEIYNIAVDIMENKEKYQKACDGKVLASLFFEPSTRTNLSFTTAMYRLGGQVMGFSDSGSSSASKGESLKDTITVISKYADIIVMRNPQEGSALCATQYSEVPIINAGDGGHLHPTQTLTDLVTIKKYRGSLDNMTVGICGDLKYGRTVHSLIKSLAKYENIKFILVSPHELKLPEYIIDYMDSHNLNYEFETDLDNKINEFDILYMTRIQRERFDDIAQYERLKNVYILDEHKMSHAKENMLVLHPLPRVDEITDGVDLDPRAKYFEQAECGMYARMALILTLLENNKRKKPETISFANTDKKCINPKCITQTEKYLKPIFEDICGYCDKNLKK